MLSRFEYNSCNLKMERIFERKQANTLETSFWNIFLPVKCVCSCMPIFLKCEYFSVPFYILQCNHYNAVELSDYLLLYVFICIHFFLVTLGTLFYQKLDCICVNSLVNIHR